MLTLSVNKVINYTCTGKAEEKLFAQRGKERQNYILKILPKAWHTAYSKSLEFSEMFVPQP